MFPLFVLAWVLADTSDPASSVVDALLKGGPFAIIVLLFILDKLDTTSERDLLRLQVAQSQERERTLYEYIKNDFATAQAETNRLQSDSIKALERVTLALDRRPG